VITARFDAVNPRAIGTKAAAHWCFAGSGGRQSDGAACGCSPPTRPRPVTLAPISTPSSPPAIAEADAFFAERIAQAPRTEAFRVARQAYAGLALDQAVLPLRSSKTGSKATLSSRRHPRAGTAAGTPIGAISSTAT